MGRRRPGCGDAVNRLGAILMRRRGPFAMCQLLGMNANTPTDVMFSFTGFAPRAEEHRDGFGIAFFEDKGVRLFVDTSRARESTVAEMVRRDPIRSATIVAPIRKAPPG